MRMLGSFELLVDGRQIPSDAWKSKKALTLLQYLAARAGEKTRNHELVALLWPGADMESAGPNLHTAVYNARRVIEPSCSKRALESRIRHSEGFYWYSLHDFDFLDTKEFTEAVELSQTLRSVDSENALAAAMHALTLYRGDFLSDCLYEEWTAPLRDKYREMYLETVMQAAAMLNEDKQYVAAVDLLKAAISRDPFYEELYQLAIENLLAAGCYSDAVHLFRQCATMLDEEFGLKPTEDLCDLVRQAQGRSVDLPEKSGATNDNLAAESGAFVCTTQIFESMVDVETRRFRRQRRPFSVLSVEAAGGLPDEVLLNVTKKTLRESDVICQWTPNQVLALLPNTDESGTSVVARRLRHAKVLCDGAPVDVDFKVVSGESEEGLSNLLDRFRR